MAISWYTYPITWYMYRDMPACELTPEQCAFSRRPFRNWYIADLVYARGTVYFFLVALFFCSAAFYALKYTPPQTRSTNRTWQRLTASLRLLAYRRYQVPVVRSTTPSLGVMLLLGAGFAFFVLMALAPQPYYWPTTAAFGDSPPLATRTGWLALGATPFLLMFAAKASVIGQITGSSHEKLMVFHAWLGWAVLVLALLHTFPFIVYNYRMNMMAEMWDSMFYYWTGVAALVPLAYLTFMSVPWIRNRWYEFFKATHYLAALVFMVFFFIHCGFTLTSADYFVAALALYGCSWCYSQLKTWFDHGVRRRATLTQLSPHTLRIDIPVGSFTFWRPGQHIFLRFVSLAGLSAHPFSISSLPDSDKLIGEPHSVMTFYVKPRGGLTARLASVAAAAAARGDKSGFPVLLEGAYGGLPGRPLTAYDRALVLACGSGAGFSLPFVMEWMRAAARVHLVPGLADAAAVESKASHTPPATAPKKMSVVLATRDVTLLDWYEAALVDFVETQRLDVPAGVLEIMVHLTSDDAAAAAATAATKGRRPSSWSTGWGDKFPWRNGSAKDAEAFDITVSTGRPDLAAVVRRVTTEERGSVGITVCGPSAVLEAVRDAAAEAEARIVSGAEGAREVYLYSERFGW